MRQRSSTSPQTSSGAMKRPHARRWLAGTSWMQRSVACMQCMREPCQGSTVQCKGAGDDPHGEVMRTAAAAVVEVRQAPLAPRISSAAPLLTGRHPLFRFGDGERPYPCDPAHLTPSMSTRGIWADSPGAAAARPLLRPWLCCACSVDMTCDTAGGASSVEGL